MLFGNKKRFVVKTLGDQTLAKVAERVEKVDGKVRLLAETMTRTMELFNGIGLAAPQVGAALRLVVFGVPADSMGQNPTPGEVMLLPRMPLVVVNPEIVSFGEELGEYDEGCLSVPDIYAPVIRPLTVVFRAQTLDGETIECECGGLLARCIQHELDHLEGMVFLDRLSPEAAAEVAPKVKALKRYGTKHDFERVIRAPGK